MNVELDVHVVNALRMHSGREDMSSTNPGEDAERARIMLGLLESVDRDGAQSQRRLASDLGIALGLVNAYLKRCVKKGLVKVSEAPARRYAYYLTPQGFAEKSRLTVEYLSYSFSFFRRARADCAEVLNTAAARGWKRVVLAGMSDLAEIARLCALESGVEIVAVVAHEATQPTFVGVPVVATFEDVVAPFDGIIVTELRRPRETFELAGLQLGPERVLAPTLLGVRRRVREEKVDA
jgi:DNA-binding MarR family transcriptional regulator